MAWRETTGAPPNLWCRMVHRRWWRFQRSFGMNYCHVRCEKCGREWVEFEPYRK